jgi:Autoinducer binding domain
MAELIADPKAAAFYSFEEAHTHLEQAAAHAGVKHLSYWYLQFLDGLPDQVVWVATYDPTYMSRYMSKFTPMGDPVMGRVMDESVTIDWNEWHLSDGVSESIWAVAKTYNITKYGLSFPIRGEGEDKIIFSVNVDSDDNVWREQRGILAARFRPFAHEFNARMKPLVASRQTGDSVYSL